MELAFFLGGGGVEGCPVSPQDEWHASRTPKQGQTSLRSRVRTMQACPPADLPRFLVLATLPAERR